MSGIRFPLRNAPSPKSVWSIASTSSDGSKWSLGLSFDGLVAGSHVVPTTNKLGGLEVFVRGEDDRCYHNWQNRPNGAWSGWQALSGSKDFKMKDAPAQAVGIKGARAVLAVGQDDHLWCNQQELGADGQVTAWGDWQKLGMQKVRGGPSLSAHKDGRLEAFAFTMDGSLAHTWQKDDGTWSGDWGDLGTPVLDTEHWKEQHPGQDTDGSALVPGIPGLDGRKQDPTPALRQVPGSEIITVTNASV